MVELATRTILAFTGLCVMRADRLLLPHWQAKSTQPDCKLQRMVKPAALPKLAMPCSCIEVTHQLSRPLRKLFHWCLMLRLFDKMT